MQIFREDITEIQSKPSLGRVFSRTRRERRIIVNNKREIARGFTIIELLVSIGIFLILTTSFLFSYNGFNNRIGLETLAQQIGQWMRDAQVSAMSVRYTTGGATSPGYGLHFATATPDRFIYFADKNATHVYDAGDELEREVLLYKGNVVSSLEGQIGVNPLSSVGKFDIVFTRPDPDAIISDENGDYRIGIRP